MAIVATLLDKAKQAKSLTSDSALAAALGTNRQVVSQWRNGDSYPSEDNIAALALMGGDDPTQWLVAIKAVRSEGSAGKYWAALAKRLAATAMTLALGMSFALPARAQDAVAAFEGSHSIHYAKFRIGRTRPGALDLTVDQVFLASSLLSRNGTRSMSDSYNHVIDNHVDLHGPWAGWRLAGRDLVAPSGERIPERRLRGLFGSMAG